MSGDVERSERVRGGGVGGRHLDGEEHASDRSAEGGDHADGRRRGEDSALLGVVELDRAEGRQPHEQHGHRRRQVHHRPLAPDLEARRERGGEADRLGDEGLGREVAREPVAGEDRLCGPHRMHAGSSYQHLP